MAESFTAGNRLPIGKVREKELDCSGREQETRPKLSISHYNITIPILKLFLHSISTKNVIKVMYFPSSIS